MMVRSLRIVIGLLLTILYACDGYKILVLFPSPGGSHRILADGYVRHLTAAGHEVTLISPYSTEHNNSKLREITVGENLKHLEEMDLLSLEAMMAQQVDIVDQRFTLGFFGMVARQTLKNEDVQKLLNDPNEHFDAVVAEWLYDEIYSGLGAVFNCPFIWSSTVDPHWMVLQLIDEPSNPAYVADSMSSIAPPFIFIFNDPIVEESYKSIYGPIVTKKGRILPPYMDVMYNASLMLGNSHVSFGQPLKLPENYKSIGGYHIETEVKPLPSNLQKLMDDAKHGVIYFSMGSNLKSAGLPKEMKTNLLKMFGNLKYTVLWKFEENLPDTPENVHILKWAPQQSILNHPNCKLFITHGGMLSTTETVHFGKPIIAIPVYGDQFVNSQAAVNKGFAIRLTLSYDLDKDLKNAIDEITSNPRYSQRAKELSFIYHDRPVSPGKELVHWVEHVVKTRGAPHLRSPALMVPWYQKMYLDLLGIILIILTSLYVVIVTLFCKRQVDLNKKNK